MKSRATRILALSALAVATCAVACTAGLETPGWGLDPMVVSVVTRPNSAHVTWEPVSGALGYQLTIVKLSGSAADPVDQRMATTDTAYDLEAEGNASYQFEVRGRTAFGMGTGIGRGYGSVRVTAMTNGNPALTRFVQSGRIDGTDADYQLGLTVAMGLFSGGTRADAVIQDTEDSLYGAGRVLVYRGGARLDASDPLILQGSGAADEFGSAFAVGDVDGDGYQDLAVGAQSRTTLTGTVYLFLGGPDGLAQTPAWAQMASTAQYRFGGSLAMADVNGDGRADLLVGAQNCGSGAPGCVTLFLGTAGGLTTSPIPGPVDSGNSSSPSFPILLRMGDLDGDGREDVAVHFGRDRDSGGTPKRVDVFPGTASGLGNVPIWSAFGAGADRSFADSIAVGDVNGDGRSDLIVSDPESALALLYVAGSAGLPSSPSVWMQTGEDGVLYHGAPVPPALCAGDLDGDGFAEVIFADNYSNKLRIFRGGSVLSTAASLIFTAREADPQNSDSGWALACDHDFNGDGAKDLLAGVSKYPYVFNAWRGQARLFLRLPEEGPSVTLGPIAGRAGVAVSAQITLAIDAPGGAVCRWDWGEGPLEEVPCGAGPTQSNTHTYASAGEYLVVVRITNDYGLAGESAVLAEIRR